MQGKEHFQTHSKGHHHPDPKPDKDKTKKKTTGQYH